MKKLLLTIALVGTLGCTSKDPSAQIEDGMTVAEVQEVMGESGKELPNLTGDSRTLLIFDLEAGQMGVAFEDGVCVGSKMMP